MNTETLIHLTIKLLSEDERNRNKTSYYSHFYEWSLRYFRNGLVDESRILDMLSKRRELILDELFFLDLIVPKSKRITK